MSTPTILYVGAGRVGLPILLRLIAHGLEVYASDTSADVLADLRARGVAVHEPDAISPLAFSRVVLCLPAADAASALIDAWAEHGLPADTIIADITTMAPETARRHAKRIVEAGGSYLDTPVSGGQRGAESGDMVVVASGDRSAFDAMQPIFRAIGSTVHYAGPAGTASQIKAVNQFVYLSYNLAFAHGLRLGHELGLADSVVFDMLTKGAAGHPLINDRLPMTIQSGFSEGFVLKRCLKDLDCLELVEGQASAASEAHRRLREAIFEAVAAGMGDLDILALSRTERGR